MTQRQITIVWLSLTLLVPSGYFAVSRGLEGEIAVRENREIREGTEDRGTHIRKFLVTFEREGRTVTYEIKSDHFPNSDEETEKLIASGRQLSEREAKAWQERDEVEKSRRRYWEFATAAFFVFVSLSSLLVFRARKKEPNKTPEPTTMTVTPRAPSSTSRADHGRGSS